ncbi:hypothetical protein [Bradyrhizobium sp.]|uniref:hypothetical protein n=1 Tax=Bradyrhizobium sp. TaxID=376 RepID=UPI0007C8D9D9|nr:hypothetical protein [Bradyrhizobium sp.]
MILLPQTIIEILSFGGSVRVAAKGLMPQTLNQYAAAAKSGGGIVEFVVGDTILLPQTLNEVSSFGAPGHVRWDFVTSA